MNTLSDEPPVAALFGDENNIEYVYAQGRRDKLAQLTQLLPDVVRTARLEEELNLLEAQGVLRKLSVIFSTWGMPLLSTQHLERMPSLKAVFYAAGAVQTFAQPFLERGIIVVSAWQANAVPVAEWTLAQILLSNKGYHRNTRSCTSPQAWRKRIHGPGNFGETVALLGAGAIGRKVIELLRPFNLKVIVFDPFLNNEDARILGIEKVSLLQAFERGLVISNHLANKEEIAGVLNADLFERMRPGATFLNTGRGRTVNEGDLMRVLLARPDLTALLDVTDPEPPLPDSLLYRMPNVHLTSHLAGSIGDETVRMADYMIDEFKRWQAGEPLHYAVTLKQLTTMA